MMLDPISRLLHRGAGKHGPAMLMYHSVSAGNRTPDWPWAISMRRFREQLDFLANAGWQTLTMGELAAAARPPERSVVITFDDGYADNFAAFEELQQRGMRASWFVVTGSLGQAPAWRDTDLPPGRLLNIDELRAMQSAGMEIGSHTHSHARLPTVDDRQLAEELRHSKAILEDLLSSAVTSFAYPHGLWDARCESAVQQAGYHCACTTQTGWALRDGNPYTLRRLTVFNTDTTSNLARMLALGLNHAAWPEVGRYALARLQQRLGNKA